MLVDQILDQPADHCKINSKSFSDVFQWKCGNVESGEYSINAYVKIMVIEQGSFYNCPFLEWFSHCSNIFCSPFYSLLIGLVFMFHHFKEFSTKNGQTVSKIELASNRVSFFTFISNQQTTKNKKQKKTWFWGKRRLSQLSEIYLPRWPSSLEHKLCYNRCFIWPFA